MDALILIPVLLLSIVLHEVAHGWQARREGDPTAEREGRITLNPVPHIDPVGSVIVPAILWFSGAGILFGWAKPVPVRPGNYRDPVGGDIRVSLAGVAVNFGLALAFTVAGAVTVTTFGPEGPLGGPLYFACRIGILLNLLLAFFNLIPIPPLDGSHVVYHLLPEGLRGPYRAAGRYGLLVLMALLFLVPGAFDLLLVPIDLLMGKAESFMRLWY